MKLIVISPEGSEPRELAVMEGLFKEGLGRYHVRKPAWSASELESWILGLPAEWRPRLVLHQHHELVAKLGLGGAHDRDTPHSDPGTAGSRSCHDLGAIRTHRTRYTYLVYGPVFQSFSKPAYGPQGDGSRDDLRKVLGEGAASRARVYAIGGISDATLHQCHALGFGGAALHGFIWGNPDPVGAFARVRALAATLETPASPGRLGLPRLLCLTQDGTGLGHAEQARQMCEAGGRFIQLRMKGADRSAWLAEASAAVSVCKAHGAILIVNDSVEIAAESGADGVHLGSTDEGWSDARRRLGLGKIIGGTVNNLGDARRAAAAGVLGYVGVGPLRFTATKRDLAPVLGLDGIGALLGELAPLPAWVIGGVRPDDIPGLRERGAWNVAVSSGLTRGGTIAENVRHYLRDLSLSHSPADLIHS